MSEENTTEQSEPILVASYRIPEKKKRGGRRICFWLALLFLISTIALSAMAIWNYVSWKKIQAEKNQLEKENAELQKENTELVDIAEKIISDKSQLQNDSTQLKNEISQVQIDRDKLQEENEQLKSENEKLKDDYEKLLNSEVHVDVSRIYNYENFSTYLDSLEITYLFLNYRVSTASNFSGQEKLFIKILEPDGTLMTGISSPEGYTMEVSPYSSQSGWGSHTPGAYHPGEYKIEFWYKEICVGQKTVQIF